MPGYNGGAGGRPRKFESPEDLIEAFNNYIEHCRQIDFMPNIAGFCCYIDIVKDTFYSYSNNYPEFSDSIKRIDQALENAVLNNKTQKDLIKIAYLNNRHKYSNKETIDLNANITKAETLTDTELEAKIAELQHKINKG